MAIHKKMDLGVYRLIRKIDRSHTQRNNLRMRMYFVSNVYALKTPGVMDSMASTHESASKCFLIRSYSTPKIRDLRDACCKVQYGS